MAMGIRACLLMLAVARGIIGTCPGMEHGTPPSGYDPDIPDAATYGAALRQLDLEAVVADLQSLFTRSQECWPADFGSYGPLFIRLAWHCSGTYRKLDKRGGCGGGRQRFEPERSWPDNTNLDKARALLWPIKRKYGAGLSWGDLFTLAGTAAIKSMGGPISGYCAGRVDSADGSESVILGPSPEQERVAPCEVNGKCKSPLGASTVGLIYVNPEGPVAQGEDGQWRPDPNPAKSAIDIRDVFGRMGFNDTQTVALIGGGHEFGKTHGACPAGAGPSPEENVISPWPGLCGTGRGKDAFTSGFEGPWTTEPTRWTNEFFVNLVKYQWEKHVGPGGHWQWRPKNASNADAGIMRLTSDVALVHDTTYAGIVKEFAHHPHKFDAAFDQAWFELTTHGGYWSKERKCLSGHRIPVAMRGDDVELAKVAAIANDHATAKDGLDWESRTAVARATQLAVCLLVSGALGASCLLSWVLRGRRSAADSNVGYDRLGDQM